MRIPATTQSNNVFFFATRKKIKFHTNLILLIISYECETWFLPLKGEHGRTEFMNRELKKRSDL